MSSPFQGALPPLSQPSDLPEMWVLLGCVVLASCLVVSLERTESLGQVTWGCHGPRGAGGSQREAGGATVRGGEGALLAGVPAPPAPLA